MESNTAYLVISPPTLSDLLVSPWRTVSSLSVFKFSERDDENSDDSDSSNDTQLNCGLLIMSLKFDAVLFNKVQLNPLLTWSNDQLKFESELQLLFIPISPQQSLLNRLARVVSSREADTQLGTGKSKPQLETETTLIIHDKYGERSTDTAWYSTH